MTHTTTVILPWSYWEVYSLTFVWRRGAVFMVKEGPAIHVEGVGPHGPWQKRLVHLLLSYLDLSILPSYCYFFKSIFLVKQTDLVDFLQVILFHLECRYEGKLLILGLLLDSIFASYLRKAHFVSNLGGFLVTVPSLVWRAPCMSIFSPKLPILVIKLLMAFVSLLLVCFSTNWQNLASKFCLSNCYD